MTTTMIRLPETLSVALMVIAGDYDSGDKRKRLLEEAGYDYRTVQNCVNDVLRIIDKYK